MPYSSVALNVLQSLYINRIESSLRPPTTSKFSQLQYRKKLTEKGKEKCNDGIFPYQVSFNHVFGDFVPESDELLLGEVLCDFVIHVYITQDLSRSAPANSMNVLQRVLNSLVVRNLHTANTSALDAQAVNLHTHLQFMFYCDKVETLTVCCYLWCMRIQNGNRDCVGEASIGDYSE